MPPSNDAPGPRFTDHELDRVERDLASLLEDFDWGPGEKYLRPSMLRHKLGERGHSRLRIGATLARLVERGVFEMRDHVPEGFLDPEPRKFITDRERWFGYVARRNEDPAVATRQAAERGPLRVGRTPRPASPSANGLPDLGNWDTAATERELAGRYLVGEIELTAQEQSRLYGIDDDEPVAVQHPEKIALCEWAKRGTLAGKFPLGWCDLPEACRWWGIAVDDEANEWLPVIERYMRLLHGQPQTEAELIGYLHEAHGLRPSEAKNLPLARLADLLKADWERRAGATRQPDSSPAESAHAPKTERAGEARSGQGAPDGLRPTDGDLDSKGRVYLAGGYHRFGPQQKRLLVWVLRNQKGRAEQAVRDLGLSGDDHLNKLLFDLRASVNSRLKKADRNLNILLDGQVLTHSWAERRKG